MDGESDGSTLGALELEGTGEVVGAVVGAGCQL